MMNFEWAKPVATELLVIIMSRPFAVKLAAKWAIRKQYFQNRAIGIDAAGLELKV